MDKKKRISRIAGGGLRQFSLIVCRKVHMKGRTTYSEVADEIITEFASPDVNPLPLNKFDEKNIRRRVYDALNVLMALNIIAKDRKEIHWKGFPKTTATEIKELEDTRLDLMCRLEKKARYLHDLEEHISGLKSLMLRNEQLLKSEDMAAQVIDLPFILVRTQTEATVEIDVSEDMRLVHFDFNGSPFSLHNDVYILKVMRSQDSDCRGISLSSGASLPSHQANTDNSVVTIPFSWSSEILKV